MYEEGEYKFPNVNVLGFRKYQNWFYPFNVILNPKWTPIHRIYLEVSTVYRFFLSAISRNRINSSTNIRGTGYPSSKVTKLNGCPVAFLCSVAVSLSGNWLLHLSHLYAVYITNALYLLLVNIVSYFCSLINTCPKFIWGYHVITSATKSSLLLGINIYRNIAIFLEGNVTIEVFN